MTTPWFDTRTSVKGWLLVLVVVATIVVLFLTTGRGGRIVADGPVVRHESGWGLGGSSGMDAIVGGTLEITDGCLLLDGHAVVWPDGTSWDEDRQLVRLPDRARLAEGWTVTGGGGSSDGPPDAADWERYALAGCLARATGVVQFNADAQLEVTSPAVAAPGAWHLSGPGAGREPAAASSGWRPRPRPWRRGRCAG